MNCPKCNTEMHRDKCVNPHCRIEELEAEIDWLKQENEQLQVQMAGCCTAALGGLIDPATKGMYGWSPTYQDVLDLRIRYERLKQELATEREKVREA